MFDMLQSGEPTVHTNDLFDIDNADDFGDFDDFECLLESERLAEIIQFTQLAAPRVPHNPTQVAAELDTVAPGVHLGAMLDQVKVATVSGYEQIAALRAHQRMASHHQAMVYQTMAAIVDTMESEFDDLESQIHAATAEIRVALRLTRRATDIELEMALSMVRRLPHVIAALQAGTIDPRRARAIVHGTTHLDDDTARDVVDAIIDDAPRLTTGQLVARLRKLCIDVDPNQAAKRYHQAVEQRHLTTQATEAGTTNLYGTDLPPHRVAAAMAHLNHTARTLRNQGDTRSMDQLRADVFLDLIEGTHTRGNSRGGGVTIHVDLTTLAGLTEHPGELAGYGPVIADIARSITEHQTNTPWTYTITDPDTGMLIDAGTTRRRPTTTQRRYVKARDQVCVFPGCRMPATDCDLDHIKPHAHDGITSIGNLAPACRHDHTTHTKELGWTYQRLPNSDYQWTTKLGHTYTTTGKPHPRNTTHQPRNQQEPNRVTANETKQDTTTTTNLPPTRIPPKPSRSTADPHRSVSTTSKTRAAALGLTRANGQLES